MSVRHPHMLTAPDGRRLTVLDCELGNHNGHFAIRKVTIMGREAWGCERCISEMAEGLRG